MFWKKVRIKCVVALRVSRVKNSSHPTILTALNYFHSYNMKNERWRVLGRSWFLSFSWIILLCVGIGSWWVCWRKFSCWWGWAPKDATCMKSSASKLVHRMRKEKDRKQLLRRGKIKHCLCFASSQK